MAKKSQVTSQKDSPHWVPGTAFKYHPIVLLLFKQEGTTWDYFEKQIRYALAC